MLVGNAARRHFLSAAAAGIGFARNNLLRIAVVLYGLRLTVRDINAVGLTGVLIDALMLGSTFALALLLGVRVFRLERTTAILIGAGSAICGAAAVLATEPVVRGKPGQVTMAVATVVLFGTLAIFVYPLLYTLSLHWGLLPQGPQAFGVYAGSTIHEVAQVFAAAHSVSNAAADTAVITKMVRVMMLAPFLLMLSLWTTRRAASVTQDSAAEAGKIHVPWFAFGFIGMVLFNSLALLPQPVVSAAIHLDNLLLAMAMAALGVGTQLSAIRTAGLRPLLLAALLALWLVVGGGLVNHFAMKLA